MAPRFHGTDRIAATLQLGSSDSLNSRISSGIARESETLLEDERVHFHHL